jgi:hypothetical protein
MWATSQFGDPRDPNDGHAVDVPIVLVRQKNRPGGNESPRRVKVSYASRRADMIARDAILPINLASRKWEIGWCDKNTRLRKRDSGTGAKCRFFCSLLFPIWRLRWEGLSFAFQRRQTALDVPDDVDSSCRASAVSGGSSA